MATKKNKSAVELSKLRMVKISASRRKEIATLASKAAARIRTMEAQRRRALQ